MSRKSNFLRNHDFDGITSNVTMSDKVQLVANNIYKEFERMISHFGSDVLEYLMPLIVGVLENLDELYKTKQSDDLEIEIIKEDNETLSNQYEKERTLRKQAEERLLDLEFLCEEEKKSLQEKNQELESLFRISELKLRSSHDMVMRLEEKEKELKFESQKWHERYAESFKSHADLLQRLKLCNVPMSSPISQTNASTRNNKQHEMSVDEVAERSASSANSYAKRTRKDDDYSPSHMLIDQRRNNYKEETVAEIFGDDNWMTDTISESLLQTQQQHLLSNDLSPSNMENKSSGFISCANIDEDLGTAENSLEFTNPDSDTDMTDDEFGIRKEIECLIKENQDLIDTKNALNVVKDDLISRLDILTSENDMLREDIHQNLNRQADLIAKITFLEQEVKNYKEELRILNETKLSSNTSSTEINVEKKTFSRTDMAILLQERNYFKERLMELQDALVYTEMMRVKKQFPDTVESGKQSKQNSSSVWNLFNKLMKSSKPERKSVPSSFKNVSKTDGDEVPASIEEKSKILRNRFRLENNRSQLYSWSIPRPLIESSLPKRIPIPIKIQKIFEPKDVVICSTLGFEESCADVHATYLWCLTLSANKQYALVNVSLSSKQPELVNKYSINLQFPTSPFNICEVPALIHVIKELSSIRPSGDNEVACSMNGDCHNVQSESTKVTKIFHTKVHIKQKSKCIIGSKTLWFGCEKNQLAVFVLFDNNKLEGRMATANLPSEIDFIKYYVGRVFVMTKNGSLCIFDLNKEVNQWDLHQCLVMDLSNGLPISTSCCDGQLLQLWLGSSTNCLVLSLSHLTVQKSWTVTEDSPALDQCIAIESIVKIDKLSIMIMAISRVGSLIGYDTSNYELKLSVDLRPCVFDVIEPVCGVLKTSLSFYRLVDDGNRLWVVSECGMIMVVTLDCLRSHLRNRKTKVSLQSDEVLISSHAFAQSVKSISLLTYSSSTLSFGDHQCSTITSDSKTPDEKGGLLMTAIGSCYINLNNTIADTLNLSNQALIWKI